MYSIGGIEDEDIVAYYKLIRIQYVQYTLTLSFSTSLMLYRVVGAWEAIQGDFAHEAYCTPQCIIGHKYTHSLEHFVVPGGNTKHRKNTQSLSHRPEM